MVLYHCGVWYLMCRGRLLRGRSQTLALEALEIARQGTLIKLTSISGTG